MDYLPNFIEKKNIHDSNLVINKLADEMLRTSNIDKKLIHNFLRNVDITGRSGLAAANGGIAFTFFANFFFSLRCTIHIYIDSKPLATLKIQQSTI